MSRPHHVSSPTNPRAQDPAPAAGPSRQRGRINSLPGPALALVVVLVAALVLYGIDWLARIGAQSVLAGVVQQETATTDRPAVGIGGPFFLPQVVRGRYDEVSVDVVNFAAEPLRISSLHAELFDVHVPLHDVLVGSANTVIVDRATEEISLTYDNLNHYLQGTDRKVTVAPSDSGDVQLTGTFDVLGQTVTASAVAAISADQGALAVTPIKLNTDTALDQAAESLLGRGLTFLIPLDPLPFGQQITNVRWDGDGITVALEGQNIVLAP